MTPWRPAGGAAVRTWLMNRTCASRRFVWHAAAAYAESGEIAISWRNWDLRICVRGFKGGAKRQRRIESEGPLPNPPVADGCPQFARIAW